MKTTYKPVFVLFSCFLHLIPVYSYSDELLDSWKKISSNYVNDIQQSNKIYYKIKEEQRALAELRTIAERHLRHKNAEVLLNVLSSYNISNSADNLQEVLKSFAENYDNQMIDGIFAEAINEMASTKDLSELPRILSNIYQQDKNKSFETMLRAQIQLYNSFGQIQHTERKEFLRLFANNLYNIKRQPLYNTIDLGLKLKIQYIIDQLPQQYKYLYFMPYFCLQNKKHSTYIYTAIEMKVDPLSRYIWLWRDTWTMDDTGYIKAEISEANAENGQKLYVALKGIKYQMYYYMMPNTMKIAGWDSPDEPLNHIWEIEFLDNDVVVFSQNDYLMCAVENHDNDRRNVGGRKRGEVSSTSPECQWRLGNCAFKQLTF